MSRERVLVDTGPLVAILRPDDENHRVCVALSQQLPYPFLTSWAVITEAAWLLRDLPTGVAMLLMQIEAGLVTPVEMRPDAAVWLRAFLEKYRDLGAQLADASLCYLAEHQGINSVFTLDSRDFLVYRNRENRPFELLPNV